MNQPDHHYLFDNFSKATHKEIVKLNKLRATLLTASERYEHARTQYYSECDAVLQRIQTSQFNAVAAALGLTPNSIYTIRYRREQKRVQERFTLGCYLIREIPENQLCFRFYTLDHREILDIPCDKLCVGEDGILSLQEDKVVQRKWCQDVNC